MEQLTEFIGNHPLLFAALGVILALLAKELIGNVLQKHASASPMEATALINHEDAIMLDIRSQSEFDEGHILNAIHIPLTEINNRIKEIEKHKDKPIIVSCRTGDRSATACRQLAQQGFLSLYNLEGGLLAWKDANLPISKR